MNPIKVIAYVVAAIMIFFGVLFVWGAFSPDGSVGWIPIGIITICVGFGIIWFVGQKKTSPIGNDAPVMNIDLPGKVKLDTMKCQSCGGALTSDNVKMVAGAPVVTCPYCNTTYQLTEEPKW